MNEFDKKHGLGLDSLRNDTHRLRSKTIALSLLNLAVDSTVFIDVNSILSNTISKDILCTREHSAISAFLQIIDEKLTLIKKRTPVAKSSLSNYFIVMLEYRPVLCLARLRLSIGCRRPQNDTNTLRQQQHRSHTKILMKA